MDASKVAISVIILSFNTKKYSEMCLNKVAEAKEHFEKNGLRNCEVIVIDNASNDGSQEMIRKKFPFVKLYSKKSNLGFARGNNLGMSLAKGENLLLLNSDAFIEKDTLEKSLSYLKENPGVDLLGCGLVYKDGKFQPSAGYLPSPLNVFFWMFFIDKVPMIAEISAFHPNKKSFFKKDKKLGWITGAFMFMKCEVFEKTKGFDESYFMYTEEVEWCKRISDAGFTTWFTPSFKIVHLKGGSSSFDVAKPIFLETSGILYYFKKHYPDFLLFVRINLFVGYLLRFIMYTVVGKRNFSNAYLAMIKKGIWKKLP